MKILIMSDSHGRKNILSDIITENKDADVLIYLGDGINDFEEALFENGLNYDNKEKEIIEVLGNCDTFGRRTDPLIRNICGINFYVTHGADENVKLGLFTLAERAKQNDCKIALYGHTHIASCIEKDEIKFFNPGTVTKGEYGIIEIKKDNACFYLRCI